MYVLALRHVRLPGKADHGQFRPQYRLAASLCTGALSTPVPGRSGSHQDRLTARVMNKVTPLVTNFPSSHAITAQSSHHRVKIVVETSGQLTNGYSACLYLDQ